MACKLVAAVLIAVIVAASAHAAAPKQIVVAYGDLDLNTIAGQAELTNRLRAAAANLCSPVLAWAPDSEPSIHEHQILYHACVGRLAERAMAKITVSRN